MRSRQDIKNEMTANFVNNDRIKSAYGLTDGLSFEAQFSLASFENVIFDIISYSLYVFELLFVQHIKVVDNQLKNQKSGRLPWYRDMALKFQYGFDLVTDRDYYDNTGYSFDQVEASKIIKYAAVNEGDEQGTIIVKVAGESNGVLSPISAPAQTSVEAYFDEVRYAGSYITVINFLPDRLFLTLNIYRDPLVLDANGVSILDGDKPVETALVEFMKELPFDGELILAHLIDKLQQVQGVVIPDLIEAKSNWIDVNAGDYGVATVINVKRIPVSGYYEIPNFDGITYVV